MRDGLGLDVVLLVIAIMGGRVIPSFTNNAIPGAGARRDKWIEYGALGSVVVVLGFDLLQLPVWPIAFAAAAHNGPGEPGPEAPSKREPLAAPSDGFFIEAPSPVMATQVPIEVLLLQIERHVRLEHAAAEAFQQAPTPELLHIRTASPLVH